MGGLISKLAVKFLKARWGSILPAIFKAAAEGQFGEGVKGAYWFAAKYKTFVGAVLWGLGAGLESVCSNYPTMPWSCRVAVWIYYAGMVLTGVGLADGGTRSPWPSTPDGNAPFSFEEKK